MDRNMGWVDEDKFWDAELYSGRLEEAAINREAEAPTQTFLLSFTIPKALSTSPSQQSWPDGETVATQRSQRALDGVNAQDSPFTPAKVGDSWFPGYCGPGLDT